MRVINEYVGIYPDTRETTTAGGIILPDTRAQDRVVTGVVFSVGAGAPAHEREAIGCDPGDRVQYKAHGCARHTHPVTGRECVIVRARNVLGVVCDEVAHG